FVDPMPERHVELRAYRSVAGVTKLGLPLCQQALLSLRCVYRVASRADYIRLGVTGTADVCPVEILSMTAETILENFLRTEFGEGDDRGLTSTRFDVRLSGAMAAFAAGVFGRAISRRDTF